jgi:hypothetical protein
VLVKKNVLVKEWTERLTTALKRRDEIWSVAGALTEASFKANRLVAGSLGYKMFQEVGVEAQEIKAWSNPDNH